jgi:hypothetical protein
MDLRCWEIKEGVGFNIISDFVCLFVCVPGAKTHCGCIFIAQ